jgi:threonine aldolase
VTAPIDLRSDTVTRPSPGMRKAMYEAEVGDIQYDDDPTVNRLQERVADLLGKEASLWLPSGTQANQVALLVLTRPGDDVIVSHESHSVWHEAGGGGANAGVQFTAIGADGTFTADDLVGAIKPAAIGLYPPTTLVQVENTHNRMGGVIFPQDEVVRICAAARAHRLATYLDGARLWNVAAETGAAPGVLAAPFDLVMVSMSKGLGAPGGSLLAGARALIAAAVRYRGMLGGAMRQVGFFAAAAEYALDHNLPRLREDHENARMLGAALTASPRVRLVSRRIETNILVFEVLAPAPDAPSIVAMARERGVLINAFGARKLRAVTHLDAPRDACAKAGAILLEIIGG